jgi:hypothetical protein
LFSAAIYLKKKHKDKFTSDLLQDMNAYLEAPLEQKDIDSIYTSVTTHGYDHYSCKNPPCADYCDKKLCALREYGIGNEKRNHFTGADCWGELSRVMAKNPYYVWDVRVNPEDEFKPVRVDSERDLRSQAVMQELCWRDLNWAPFRVKENDWTATVNKAMEGIGNRQIPVPQGTDTTELGRLHGLFTKYLTRKQIQRGQPYMVRQGQVYHADGIYYFSTDGIIDFLRFETFTQRGVNVHDELIPYGCADGEIRYKTAKGEEKIIKCWTRPDDAELLEMDSFYEEVYDGNADIIRKIKLDDEREGGGGEDIKF